MVTIEYRVVRSGTRPPCIAFRCSEDEFLRALFPQDASTFTRWMDPNLFVEFTYGKVPLCTFTAVMAKNSKRATFTKKQDLLA